MNKNIVIGAGILILLIIGGFVFVQSQLQTNEDEAMQADDVMMQEDDAMESENMNDEDTMMDDDMALQNTDDRYVAYSQAALDGAIDSRRVLFFYANWCPTCRPADADFEENLSKIPSDVKVIRVNYNDTETDEEEEALATKYGVTYQHTFVQINEQGEQVTKWNGGDTAELLANIQ